MWKKFFYISYKMEKSKIIVKLKPSTKADTKFVVTIKEGE